MSPKLLIISAPIASGKSSVAEALAADFRASGRITAVVDLDRMYMMLDGRSPMDNPSIWREARRVAAALTDQFVLDGIELIIVEGTFWTRSERDEFTGCLSTAIRPVFVTLRVSVEVALLRVEADTGRRSSRIPDLLRASHAEFTAAPPIATDITLDLTDVPVAEVASTIRAALVHEGSPAASDANLPPLFRDVDCVQIPVPDLDAGLAFYREALGRPLAWRSETAAGLRMAESATELVIQTERPELETNLSVASAEAAAHQFVQAGGALVVAPFDISIGRCAVVQDLWGNRLVVLDHSRGRLLTDASRQVVHGPNGSVQTQASR